MALSKEEKRLRNRAKHKAWRTANPERWREIQNKYRASHRDALLAKGRANARRDRERRYATTNQWRAAHKDQIKEARKIDYSKNKVYYRDRHLKRQFGITPEIYERMLAEQCGRCAICGTDAPRGRAGRFVVDHDHVTGKVRALLCLHCNCGIGMLGDDSARVQMAADYLRRHNQRAEVA